MTIDYYDAAETWSRDHIAAAQLTRLRSLVEHSRKCAFYRERLDAAGVTPDSLRTLDDVRKIPFTTKDQHSNDQCDNQQDNNCPKKQRKLFCRFGKLLEFVLQFLHFIICLCQ